MLQRLGIIADDLTGANDTGVQFACHGYRTTVYLDDISHYNYADVLVLNTDSRQDPAQQAGRKAFEAANELLNAGVGRIYKKIDSVMRGNIGAELDQVCAASGCQTAFICPAFPALGRTVVNGEVRINGLPIHASVITRDHITPVKSASICDIIRQQSQRQMIHLTLAQVRGAQLRNRLASYVGQACYVVMDAETEEDMKAIGSILSELEGAFVLCGSGGLARALLDGETSHENYLRKACQRILVTCGTPNPVAREQIAYLGEMGWPTELISFDDLLHKRWDGGRILRGMDETGVGIIGIRDTVFSGDVYQDSLIIRENLAELVVKICHKRLPDTLIINGGDTALSICRKLGAWGFDLIGEVDTGIPYGLLQNDWGQNLAVITKSGSFGDKCTLHKAILALRDRQREPASAVVG